MKHCILVKFKEDIRKDEQLYDDIFKLFNNCLSIEGITKVNLIKNCIERSNRYDLLIQIEMNKEALEAYDNCKWHKLWKENYSDLLDKKAIFDYE